MKEIVYANVRTEYADSRPDCVPNLSTIKADASEIVLVCRHLPTMMEQLMLPYLRGQATVPWFGVAREQKLPMSSRRTPLIDE